MRRTIESGKGNVPSQRQNLDLSRPVRETVNFARATREVAGCRLDIESPRDSITEINALFFGRLSRPELQPRSAEAIPKALRTACGFPVADERSRRIVR